MAAIAAAVLLPTLVMADTTDGLTPYGQIRAYYGIVSQSKEITGKSKSDSDFSSRLTSSRFGVKGKSGELDGVVELGLDGVNNGDSAKSVKVSTRKIYGVWSPTSDIQFMIGQDEAPYTFYSLSFANDDNFSGFGSTSQQRDLQAKITLFNFYFDVLNNYTASKIPNRKTTSGTTTTDISYDQKYYDVVVPKIALGYDLKIGGGDGFSVLVSPGMVYQSVKIDYDGDALNNKKINSFLGYAHAIVKVDKFSIYGNFGYGINTANLGIDYSKSFASAATSNGSSKAINPLAEADASTSSSIKNTKSMEGFVDLGYDFTVCEVRGGVGYAQAKNPNWSKTDKQIAYYGQISIPLIPKKLFLKPEVEYRNFMKDGAGNKQGHELLAGAFIQAFL